jgi:carbonic anhydrase/acetyltransferase-like protein (isoleucine patch superfamily)
MDGLQGTLDRLSRWKAVEIALALLVYALYAAVLGACLVPSVFLALAAFRGLVPGPLLAAGALLPGRVVLFALALAGSLYAFFSWGLLLMGCLIRLLSLAVHPGRHAAVSAVTLAWMILSGVFTLAYRLILPLVPMTFFSEMFYRLCGMRIGKRVRINSYLVMDPYMIEIGDDSVVGGDAVLSPHVFEGGFLLIEPIRIGANCLVGGQASISPGVQIGDNSTVGLRVYVRKGRKIPPGSRITSLAGMDARDIHDLERGRGGRRVPGG